MGKKHSRQLQLEEAPRWAVSEFLQPREVAQARGGRRFFSAAGWAYRPPLAWCTNSRRWGFLTRPNQEGCPVCREDACTMAVPADHNISQTAAPCRFRRSPYVRRLAGGQLPQLKPGVVPTHLIVVVRGSPWLLYTAYIWPTGATCCSQRRELIGRGLGDGAGPARPTASGWSRRGRASWTKTFTWRRAATSQGEWPTAAGPTTAPRSPCSRKGEGAPGKNTSSSHSWTRPAAITATTTTASFSPTGQQ